jgi:hypothetical protein
MTAATVVSVFLVRQVLLATLDNRIDAALVQESRELRRLAERGIDPETGDPADGPSFRCRSAKGNSQYSGQTRGLPHAEPAR